jgi:hypothetical protein
MLLTYKAILRGDRVEWIGEAPQTNGGVPVHVTVLHEGIDEDKSARGRDMADALESLAAAGGISAIPDPIAWQRETRQDRPLPGRDE